MSRLESGFLWYGASLDTSAFRGFASMYGCKTSKFTEDTMRCTDLCMTLLVFIQLFKTSDDDVFRAGWMGCICIVLYCGDGWPRDVEPVQRSLLQQSSSQPPSSQIWSPKTHHMFGEIQLEIWRNTICNLDKYNLVKQPTLQADLVKSQN